SRALARRSDARKRARRPRRAPRRAADAFRSRGGRLAASGGLGGNAEPVVPRPRRTFGGRAGGSDGGRGRPGPPDARSRRGPPVAGRSLRPRPIAPPGPPGRAPPRGGRRVVARAARGPRYGVRAAAARYDPPPACLDDRLPAVG